MKRKAVFILFIAFAMAMLAPAASSQNYHKLRVKTGDYSISLQLFGRGELGDPANLYIISKLVDGKLPLAPEDEMNELVKAFAVLKADEIANDPETLSGSLTGEFAGNRHGYRFYQITELCTKVLADGTQDVIARREGILLDKDGNVLPLEEYLGGKERLESPDGIPWDELGEILRPEEGFSGFDRQILMSHAASLCKYIPNRGMIVDSKYFMTKSFYDALTAAFALSKREPEAGGWLYRFVDGNGGGTPEFRVLDVEMNGKDTALATIEIIPSTGVETGRKQLLMRIVKGVWLLDDFDGQKARCEEFVARFRSGR